MRSVPALGPVQQGSFSCYRLCKLYWPDFLTALQCYVDGNEFYLASEVEHIVETWKKLAAAGDEHELAVFIGTEILRQRKVAEVRCHFSCKETS